MPVFDVLKKFGFELVNNKECYVLDCEDYRIEVVDIDECMGVIRVEYFGCMNEIYKYYRYYDFDTLESVVNSVVNE